MGSIPFTRNNVGRRKRRPGSARVSLFAHPRKRGRVRRPSDPCRCSRGIAARTPTAWLPQSAHRLAPERLAFPTAPRFACLWKSRPWRRAGTPPAFPRGKGPWRRPAHASPAGTRAARPWGLARGLSSIAPLRGAMEGTGAFGSPRGEGARAVVGKPLMPACRPSPVQPCGAAQASKALDGGGLRPATMKPSPATGHASRLGTAPYPRR